MLEFRVNHLFAVLRLKVQDLQGFDVGAVVLLTLGDLRKVVVLKGCLECIKVEFDYLFTTLKVHDVLLQLGIVH